MVLQYLFMKETYAPFTLLILGEIFQLSFPLAIEVLSDFRRILTVYTWTRLLGRTVPTSEKDKFTVQY